MLLRALVAALLLTVAAPVVAQDVSASDVEIRIQALTNDRPEDDAAAQSSLVKMGPGVAPHLGRVMLDAKRPWEVRTAAVWVIGEVANPESKADLNAAWAVSDAPGPFRIQVAIALGGMGELGPLHSFLDPAQPDKILVAKAAIAAANLNDASALELLKPHLADEDIGPFVAIAACRLGDSSAASQVRPLLRDAAMRDFAAVALASTGDKTVIIPLRFALANADPFIRAEAAALLARFKDHASVPKLKKLRDTDPDPRVRKAAKRAVIRIGKPRR
jgi:HEAT repeat protein